MTIRVSVWPSVAAALVRRLAELPQLVGRPAALGAGGMPLGHGGPPCLQNVNGAELAIQP